MFEADTGGGIFSKLSALSYQLSANRRQLAES
jgi:hypothetical protein